MKQLAAYIIRQRNPSFHFDEALGHWAIAQCIWQNLIQLLRGSRVLLYGRLPRYLLAGKGTSFFNLPHIQWGKFLRLGDHVLLSAAGKPGLHIGNHVSIGAFSRLVVATTLQKAGSHILIGDHVGIGEFAYLGGAGGLTIGNDCIIGQYFSCHPENHCFAHTDIPYRLQGVMRKGIVIGHNCWIGARVTILDGVTIGDNCVIAAGAVVTRSFPANSLIAGVPARMIRSIHPETAPCPDSTNNMCL